MSTNRQKFREAISIATIPWNALCTCVDSSDCLDERANEIPDEFIEKIIQACIEEEKKGKLTYSRFPEIVNEVLKDWKV